MINLSINRTVAKCSDGVGAGGEWPITSRAFCCADILCYCCPVLSLSKDRKLRVYLPAGRQVPKLGYVRSAGTVADQGYVDQDMF